MALLLFPTTAQAHLNEDAYIEKQLHQAFEKHDEVALKLLPLLTKEAEEEWEKIDQEWDEEHVVVEAPAETPEVTVASSSGAPLCDMACVGCETGGTYDPQIVSPSGTYWGWYQFDYSTWVNHGGNPASYGNAPASEQTAIASRITYDAWPNC